eukprot:10333328-Ditylum_brightwellii.AAC.1
MDHKQYMVFYNVYTDPNNPSVSNDIIKEQMLQRLPEHNRVFVCSIGAMVNVEEMVIIRRDEEGNKVDTLEILQM